MVDAILFIMAAVMVVAMVAGKRARRIAAQNKQVYKQASRHKYEKK